MCLLNIPLSQRVGRLGLRPRLSQQFSLCLFIYRQAGRDPAHPAAQPSDQAGNGLHAWIIIHAYLHSDKLIKMQTGEEELTWYCCWRRSLMAPVSLVELEHTPPFLSGWIGEYSNLPLCFCFRCLSLVFLLSSGFCFSGMSSVSLSVLALRWLL